MGEGLGRRWRSLCGRHRFHVRARIEWEDEERVGGLEFGGASPRRCWEGSSWSAVGRAGLLVVSETMQVGISWSVF